MFLNTEFTWNNVDSNSMDVVLIRTDTGELVQSPSSPKTLVTEHVRFHQTFYYGADTGTYKIAFQIMKIDGDQEPFTNEERMDLMMWFCPDNQFHCFTSEDFPELEFWVLFQKTQFTAYRYNVGVFDLEGESNTAYPTTELL